MADRKVKARPDGRKRAYTRTYKKYKPALDKMQEDSQCYLILKHILEHGSITPKEAEKKPIYSRRLGARIYELRHNPYNIPIETEIVYEKRRKKSIPHARYFLKK